LNDIATLQDTILSLENKESRTDIEESLLQAAKLIDENSQYIDESTLKEFNDIARLVKVAEDMKGLMRPEDFELISNSLTKLVEDQHNIYNEFLKTTQNIYENLEKLLKLQPEDEILPDTYISLYKVNILAKRKMAIDRIIERLKDKDSSSLADNERQALNIDKDMLSPLRDEYTGKLKLIITTFSWDIRELIKDKEPASMSKDEFGLRTIFTIDRKDLAPAAQKE